MEGSSSSKEKFKQMFIHPVTKAIVMAAFTGIIAILSAFVSKGGFWIPAIIVICVFYTIISAIYAKFDINYYRECQRFDAEVQAYEDSLRRITSACRTNSKVINEKIHEIREQGVYNPNSWNFKMACDLLCEQLRNNLTILLGRGHHQFNIGVGYVRLDENTGSEDTVTLCSYSQTRSNDLPSILSCPRKINDRSEYYDTGLFQDQIDKPVMLLTPDEVRSKFVFRRGANHDKYYQFIGIPVFCDKNGRSKMVGLLEITCIGKSFFPVELEKTSGYVDSFISPYAYLILLLHKMEKALLATPNDSVVKERISK